MASIDLVGRSVLMLQFPGQNLRAPHCLRKTDLSQRSVPWAMKGIPIGVQDFKAIRDADGYFVDKSALIDDILSRQLAGVFLFTRPRRFGKSVNLSMLDAYLNIRYKGNSWFDGLQISEMRPGDPEKNSRPMIVLDMKELGTDSMDVFTEDLKFSVAEVCKRFPELASSEKQDSDDMELFRSFKSMSSGAEVLRRSLRLITRMLEVEYGAKPVLLIDEYDSPINNRTVNRSSTTS